jgi:undecaprenyl-diphosphatase
MGAHAPMHARYAGTRPDDDRPANCVAGRVVVGLLAIGAFLAIGALVRGVGPTGVDRAVQAWVLAHQRLWAGRFFGSVTIAGGITAMWVIGVASVLLLWFRVRHVRVAAIILAPAITIGLVDSVKRVYTRPRPHGLGMGVDQNYSFPSAHATTSAAVCCALAFALWREGFISLRTAFALAVLPPLLVGSSRVYLNLHWATDVIGGWCAGLFVAALASLLYTIKEPNR